MLSLVFFYEIFFAVDTVTTLRMLSLWLETNLHFSTKRLILSHYRHFDKNGNVIRSQDHGEGMYYVLQARN